MRTDQVAAYRELMAEVYQLAGLSRVTSDRFAADYGQSAARWHVLSVITDDPATVPRIADRLGLTRQSVQRVVNDLAGAGLVKLADNPDHRRSRLVTITPTGRRLAARLFADSARQRAAALDRVGVTTRDLRAARATIQRLLLALHNDRHRQ